MMDKKDYDAVFKSIAHWRDTKEDLEENGRKVLGIGPKVYLWIFGILSIYVLLTR